MDLSWYGAAESAKVAALAETDPALPAEFTRRLLRDHALRDYEFWHAALDRAGVRFPNHPPDAEL